ncbi:hypothetical protein AB0J89_01460 [Micromonospora chokoriensis]
MSAPFPSRVEGTRPGRWRRRPGDRVLRSGRPGHPPAGAALVEQEEISHVRVHPGQERGAVVVPEKEAGSTGGGARRGEIAGRARSAACVGGRADGGHAATGPGRLADPAQTWRANGGRW